MTPQLLTQDTAKILVTPVTTEIQIIEDGTTTSTQYLNSLNEALDLAKKLGINKIEIEEWNQ